MVLNPKMTKMSYSHFKNLEIIILTNFQRLLFGDYNSDYPKNKHRYLLNILIKSENLTSDKYLIR